MPELPDVEGGLGVSDGEVGVGSVRKDNAGHPDWGPRQTNWALRRLIDVRMRTILTFKDKRERNFALKNTNHKLLKGNNNPRCKAKIINIENSNECTDLWEIVQRNYV